MRNLIKDMLSYPHIDSAILKSVQLVKMTDFFNKLVPNLEFQIEWTQAHFEFSD